MESGCCESQFPKNSHNMYVTARKGGGGGGGDGTGENCIMRLMDHVFWFASKHIGLCEHRETKEITNAHCHCKVDHNSDKHSSNETTGGRPVLAATAVGQLFILVQVSVIPFHSAQKPEQHKLFCTPEARFSHNGRLSMLH